MSVKIHINPTMRYVTEGVEVVEVSGETVGECIDQLLAKYPEIREYLFRRNGKLNNTIDIYVNMKSAYPEELAKRVKDGDEIHLVNQIAGG